MSRRLDGTPAATPVALTYRLDSADPGSRGANGCGGVKAGPVVAGEGGRGDGVDAVDAAGHAGEPTLQRRSRAYEAGAVSPVNSATRNGRLATPTSRGLLRLPRLSASAGAADPPNVMKTATSSGTPSLLVDTPANMHAVTAAAAAAVTAPPGSLRRVTTAPLRISTGLGGTRANGLPPSLPTSIHSRQATPPSPRPASAGRPALPPLFPLGALPGLPATYHLATPATTTATATAFTTPALPSPTAPNVVNDAAVMDPAAPPLRRSSTPPLGIGQSMRHPSLLVSALDEGASPARSGEAAATPAAAMADSTSNGLLVVTTPAQPPPSKSLKSSVTAVLSTAVARCQAAVAVTPAALEAAAASAAAAAAAATFRSRDNTILHSRVAPPHPEDSPLSGASAGAMTSRVDVERGATTRRRRSEHHEKGQAATRTSTPTTHRSATRDQPATERPTDFSKSSLAEALGNAVATARAWFTADSDGCVREEDDGEDAEQDEDEEGERLLGLRVREGSLSTILPTELVTAVNQCGLEQRFFVVFPQVSALHAVSLKAFMFSSLWNRLFPPLLHQC